MLALRIQCVEIMSGFQTVRHVLPHYLLAEVQVRMHNTSLARGKKRKADEPAAEQRGTKKTSTKIVASLVPKTAKNEPTVAFVSSPNCKL